MLSEVRGKVSGVEGVSYFEVSAEGEDSCSEVCGEGEASVLRGIR